MLVRFPTGPLVRAGLGLLLVLLIAGDLTEIGRLLIPSDQNFRVIHYLLLPTAALLALFAATKSQHRLRVPRASRGPLRRFAAPIVACYALDLAVHLALGLDRGVVQGAVVATAGVLFYALFIVPAFSSRHASPESYARALITPYVYYVLATSAAVVVVAPLVWGGIVDVGAWPIPRVLLIGGDFASGRAGWLHMPLLATIVELDPFGVYRFQGMSQEPHAFGLFSAPALFMWLHVSRSLGIGRRLVIAGVLVAALALTLSTTVVAVLAAIGVLVVSRNTWRPTYSRWFKTWLAVAVLAVAVLALLRSNALVSAWFLFKISAELETELNTNIYRRILSWDIPFGTGILHPAASVRIGVIAAAAYLGAYVWVLWRAMTWFLSRREGSVVALSVIYYLLHGIKSPVQAWGQPVFLYLCVAAGAVYATGRGASSKRAWSGEVDAASPGLESASAMRDAST